MPKSLSLTRAPQGTNKPRAPRPHQRRAVNAIVAALRDSARTKAIMACGTGKSLVGFWTAQALNPWTVLVLVPTVALLKQVRDDWIQETRPKSWQGPLQTLCVCSDESVVDGDAWNLEQLGVPVSTSPDDVADFVRRVQRDAGVAVIFSTYVSAPVVAQGLNALPKRFRKIDVGIFDEAHKTVGAEGKAFAFALSNSNLDIGKRIFFTATPRVIERDPLRAQPDYCVASMENAQLYGRTAFSMSFKEAVEDGLITPYKIIISVIDDSQYTSKDIDKAGYGRHANQHVVRQAMDSYGLKKALTFHSTVDAAQEFASTFERAPGSKPISLFHVSGRQSMAQRDEQMQGFVAAKRGIVTNSRCLTEGVDVPAVDLVAFVDRRRSKVDIVQAIGRALRRSEGKEYGHVLLPIHVNMRKGESIEAALERTKMGPVIDVITALFENDQDLQQSFIASMTQTARSHAGSAAPAGGLSDGSHMDDPNERPALGMEGDGRNAYLEVHTTGAGFSKSSDFRQRLFDALKTKVLGSALGGFYESLAKYAEFLRVHGKAPSQHHGSAEDKRLAHWATRMRRMLDPKDGSDARVRALNDIGFIWQGLRKSPKWERQLEELASFFKQYGEAPTTSGRRPEEFALYQWLGRARRLHRDGKLEAKRVAALRAVLGAEFGEPTIWEKRWDELFQRYASFVSKHKRLPTGAKSSSPDEKRLAQWSTQQGTERRAGNLKQERLERLLTIPDFPWSKADIDRSQWQHQFEELKGFLKKHRRRPDGSSKNAQEARLGKLVNEVLKPGLRSDPAQKRSVQAALKLAA